MKVLFSFRYIKYLNNVRLPYETKLKLSKDKEFYEVLADKTGLSLKDVSTKNRFYNLIQSMVK